MGLLINQLLNQRQHRRRARRLGAMVTLSPAQSTEVRTLDAGRRTSAAWQSSGITSFVRIPIPTKPTDTINIKTRVQVVHCVPARDQDGFKIGLRFVNLPEVAALSIRQFLEA
ncbi:hypothetical protein [Rhodoferax sp. GW822-FHT02A01]|uniref:hypothetical protein n=1 Tax=Rhodoferax sp. GW822-FHT02A01 TaxID=3141537 RepID=UPI00315D56BD